MTSPIILSIDTSCDDTSAAVTQGLTVLSNIVASQVELHKQYGGVFPTVAKQAHQQNIEPTVNLALKRAHLTWEKIDAIAVTIGPGLAPALEIGINYAKNLARKFDKPIIAVNHLEGHLLSVLAQPNSLSTEARRAKEDRSSVLSLIVSGGHTQFVKVNQIGDYQILGQTIDDAAGEVLDKVGRMLNLGYPAGGIIEKFARLGDEQAFKFPLPMTTTHDFNLSFSGLKTFARNLLEKLTGQKPLTKTQIYDFCASFQTAVFKHIFYKLNKILQNDNFGEIWLGGGVSANIKLRFMIRKSTGLKLRIPHTKKLCADNAAMIGVAAYFKFLKNEFSALENLDRQPNWPLGDTQSNLFHTTSPGLI